MNADPDHLAAAQHFFSSLMGPPFFFATDIENSNPAIHNGKHRADKLEKCTHHQLRQKNFGLVDELGIKFLRYRPPIHTTFLGPGKYD